MLHRSSPRQCPHGGGDLPPMAAAKLVAKQPPQHGATQGFPAGMLGFQHLALGDVAHRIHLAKHHLIHGARRVALIGCSPGGRRDKAQQAGYYQDNGLHL
ncbi:hypothetical protein D3C85_739460 [compost metagenome]